ncbi:aspartyl-phosphate phosphatase Spo0E family protein [Rossellomorea arthrocnemi]|uniref:aspartyl-phosphate phosphatase Spo0E family protein n=1 Tax=Rossellomorea arthrocnemi TaxID=2769542 RepID=UPI0022AA0E0C|nr:aspartyl-phosphate phosphatase Spo0E family protein [Rossellomorea arthrocnemi]
MNRLYHLNSIIEAKRRRMSDIVNKEGLTSIKAIQCSQELDELIIVAQKQTDVSGTNKV